MTSFIAFAISNNVGHALISGPSVRYRFYNAWGLSGLDMIKLSVFISVMYLLGTMTLAVAAFFFFPQIQASSSPTYFLIHAVIYTALALLIVYWLLILIFRKPLRLRNVEFSLPTPAMTLIQTLIAGIDLILASLTLYVFLQHQVELSFTTFLVIYLIAQLVGLYSQVPGGLGVFEGVFLYMMGDTVPGDSILGALILYRIVYFFVPLAFAGPGILGYELVQRRKLLAGQMQLVRNIVSQAVPQIFSLLLLISGGILLVSGATPTDTNALRWMRSFMPLPVMEISHLLGSVVGVSLLFLARAVRLRLDAAYYTSMGLLGFGIIFSLLKGADWQEATMLSLMALLLLPTRRFFYRRSSLVNVAFSWQWFLLIGIVIGTSTWFGFFSYKYIEYSNDLWWQFSYKSDASRFLRSLLVIGGAIIGFALYRLLRVSPVKAELPSPADMQELSSIVRAGQTTDSHLALLGDKTIMWSDSRKSFLMYSISRGYWIAMGDPVGRPEEMESLVWRFREMADLHGSRVAFYQVSKKYLPLYLDLGLVLIKLGEEALVSLPSFSLEGRRRSGLRQTDNKMLRLGLTFSILDHEQVAVQMPEIKEISKAWLASKGVQEKKFSLGFFAEEYIASNPVAIVKQGDEIVAFANIWETDSKHELSVDLMRYTSAAPSGVMEWLFIQLMLWGRDQGFEYFNLGMAPLAGLEKHPLAPLWHKIGNIIFERAENIYNFEGLHAYKEKFDPLWQPRYFATPPGLSLPSVFLNVTRLIAGGNIEGVFRK